MPRPARRYSKRIEVWNYAANPNSFGGNLTTDSKIGDAWAEIRSIPTNKLIDYGLDINQTSLLIYTRKRSDIDLQASDIFFKYKSVEYVPSRVTEVDLDGVELEFIVDGR